MKSSDHSGEAVSHLLEAMIAAACAAELLIMAAFRLPRHDGDVEIKHDGTPVTATDKQAEAVIRRSLGEAFPHVPLVGEESVSAGALPRIVDNRFFLIDPLDGTREFAKRSRDFTVNIAFVDGGRATHGVVLAPAHGELFTGSPAGAFKALRGDDARYVPAMAIRTRPCPARPTVIVSASRRPPALIAYLENLGHHDRIEVGSLLKVCRIAEGMADLYPCPMDTSVWDTAASQVVLEAAGGSLRRWQEGREGAALRYDAERFGSERGFLNPYFIARGEPPGDAG